MPIPKGLGCSSAIEISRIIRTAFATIGGRTSGSNHRYYWVAAARYAQTLHLAGEYQRATQLFEALVPTLPTAATGYRSSGDEHETAVANEAFGVCLLAQTGETYKARLSAVPADARTRADLTGGDQIPTQASERMLLPWSGCSKTLTRESAFWRTSPSSSGSPEIPTCGNSPEWQTSLLATA